VGIVIGGYQHLIITIGKRTVTKVSPYIREFENHTSIRGKEVQFELEKSTSTKSKVVVISDQSEFNT
jgi:hypothetical protein